MKKRRVIMLFLLALGGVVAWQFRGPLMDGWHELAGILRFNRNQAQKPDPATYATLMEDLENSRVVLADRRRAAGTATDKTEVERDARALLERMLPAMMRCWLGTPWDFNGTADGPGKGKIACGYFVSTVLKDAGFQVNRYQLAQQPSGNIIQSFVSKDACELTVGKNYTEFAKDLRHAEPGIYLVGLDTHVAFIVVRDGDFHFIHSSGSRPWCVVDEEPADAGALRRSSWRMLANLTADPSVIRRWLGEMKIVVKGI